MTTDVRVWMWRDWVVVLVVIRVTIAGEVNIEGGRAQNVQEAPGYGEQSGLAEKAESG
jgi:hypothetical protein